MPPKPGCRATGYPTASPLYREAGLFHPPPAALPTEARPVTRRPDIPIFPVFNYLPPIPLSQKQGRPASQCYSVVERTTRFPKPRPARLGNPRAIERTNEEHKEPSRCLSVCDWHRTARGPPAGYRKSIDFKWFTENWLCSFKKLARQDAGAPPTSTPNEPPAARPVPDDCKSIDSTGLIQNWLCSSKKAPDPNLDPQSRPGTGGRTCTRRHAETMNINDLTSLALFGGNLRASCTTAIRLYFHPMGGRRSGHPDATNVTECYANREKRPFVPLSKTPRHRWPDVQPKTRWNY